MPARINYIADFAVGAFTVLLTIQVTTVLSVIASLWSILYFYTRVRYIVQKHYKGSWKAYLKSLITKKLNKDEN